MKIRWSGFSTSSSELLLTMTDENGATLFMLNGGTEIAGVFGSARPKVPIFSGGSSAPQLALARWSSDVRSSGGGKKRRVVRFITDGVTELFSRSEVQINSPVKPTPTNWMRTSSSNADAVLPRKVSLCEGGGRIRVFREPTVGNAVAIQLPDGSTQLAQQVKTLEQRLANAKGTAAAAETLPRWQRPVDAAQGGGVAEA